MAAFQIDSIQEGTAPAASAGAPLLHSRKLGGPGEWRAKARGRRPRTFHRAILPAIFWFLLHRCKRNSPPRRNLCFVLRCSACGRATFQRRKVAKVLRACGPGPRGVALFRWQSRSARCPHGRCLNFITAVLLNELDRLLLQDAMRLSCRTYTVGGGRRVGPLFVCRGR